ncbi:MAG TPA: dTDP-4-dehydrorhamnose reductase [Abditibacteriaceae bacterium]|jgi:dTDP-4-dehydrorhamnose reductase
MESFASDGQVVVVGASGQVGRALISLLGARGIGLSRPAADLEHPEELLVILEALLSHHKVQAVINAAAYTQVDKAEEERDAAMRINGEAPALLARWCATREIPFVHYSTDYVFPGTGSRPWAEDDDTSPLNVYGESKLAGEQGITAAGGQYLVFRTSWVYDAFGKNFLKTMLRLGHERDKLSVVADQHGAPTYAPQLAQATLQALSHAQTEGFNRGIYHLCNGGETTWHGFAQSIFDAARSHGWDLKVQSVEAVPSAAYPTPAKRPLNSRLNNDKAQHALGVKLPHWQDGLNACLNQLRAAEPDSDARA